MWQHLLTRKSCLVDLNEKYLIIKNVENFSHILNGRARSTCDFNWSTWFRWATTVSRNRASYRTFNIH